MLRYLRVKVFDLFNSHAKFYHLVPLSLIHNFKLNINLENEDQSFKVIVSQNTCFIRITWTAS